MAHTEPMLPAELAPSQHSHGQPRTSFSVSSTGEDDHRLSFQDSEQKRGEKSDFLERLGLGHYGRRTLGISCLTITVFLWTLANFLASSMFSDNSYDKPFLVVYVNSSIFAFSLLGITLRYISKHGLVHFKNEAALVYREYKTGVKSHGGRPSDEDPDATAGERLLSDDEGSFEVIDAPLDDADDKLTFLETTKLSLEFSMLWFMANYTASACLEYTSVASVTILTSTSSVWTLILCSLLRVEAFTTRKLIGVLASLTGVILISTVDLTGKSDENRGNFPHKTFGQIALGDAMALVSAIIYGVYVTVMKRKVGDENKVNMPLFFGLVGMFILVLLWPMFFILHFTGMEPFAMPPTARIWLIILANSISSFVSDISWAYAMLLTTPLVVTVGLSLTIPLSLIGEMITYKQYSSPVYWVGAAIVVLSFLFVNNESRESTDAPASGGEAAGEESREGV
ncbi:related to integral membrane protein [Cephalotrichum gorgonifer]|uniref:Related to integral membrane protein n=1 Tax=Cephalotrichum gorgonifer TaxID=2041049 RepID=A0AAE8MU87_9PEZI|nr:related to integral membrane protein [Cephalotrichum gorgonifer]